MIENIVETRGVPAVAEFLRGIDGARCHGRHRRLLTGPLDGAEDPGAGGPRRRGAPRAGPGLGEGRARRPGAEGQDPHGRQRGHGEAPARVPAARADGRDPQGARRGRRRERRRGVPQEDRGRRHARGRREGGPARARPPGADVRAIARAGLDPHVPRLDDRDPLERPHGRQPGHRRGARRARRRPRRFAGREGPHPGVPGRPQAPAGARAGRGHRPRLGRASSRWSDPRAWARPRSASASRARSDGSSCASRSAASTTRPRSAGTGAPTSARCRAGSSAR